MSFLTRWWAWVAAVGSTATLSLFVPAVAWASDKPTLLAAGNELARPRPRGSRLGAIGLLGTVCCLAVVVIVVLLVVMVFRRGRSRRG
jgi:Na+/melibiose symporter-like transporter